MLEKKPFYLLLILAIAAGYGISFIPVSRKPLQSLAVIHDTIIQYVPHKAPAKAYLGKYENEKVPFKIKEDTTEDVTITDHQWRLDTATHEYLSHAKGYIMIKDKNGKLKPKPIKINDRQDYKLFDYNAPPFLTIPIPSTYYGMDSALLKSLKTEGIYSHRLWSEITPDKVGKAPYTFIAAGIEYKVNVITTCDDPKHPNEFATALSGTKRPVNSKGPDKDFLIVEKRTIIVQ